MLKPKWFPPIPGIQLGISKLSRFRARMTVLIAPTTPFARDSTNPRMPFMGRFITFIIPFHMLDVTLFSAFQAFVTPFLTAFATVDATFFIPFHV